MTSLSISINSIMSCTYGINNKSNPTCTETKICAHCLAEEDSNDWARSSSDPEAPQEHDGGWQTKAARGKVSNTDQGNFRRLRARHSQSERSIRPKNVISTVEQLGNVLSAAQDRSRLRVMYSSCVRSWLLVSRCICQSEQSRHKNVHESGCGEYRYCWVCH